MDRRVEIVSQWRARLASAESLAAESPRLRWIHLARVRLYRFLLSCYSSGQWREDARDSLPRAATSDLEAPLEGKPPKSVGLIQSVLKSVHTAQDKPPPVGPLTGGVDPDTYLAVTDSDARIDVARCEQFLLDHGFHPRVVGRGRRLTVEVPYCELRGAESLIDANRQRLRPQRAASALAKIRQKQPLPEESQIVLIGLFFVAPVVGLATLGIGTIILGDRQVAAVPLAWFGLVVGALFLAAVAGLMWYVAATRWMARMTLATRRQVALAVICACIGAPAAFLLGAAIYANPPALRSLTSPPAIVAILFMLIVFIAIWGDSHARRGR